MKSKTNISILDNRSVRVTPSIIIGESNGYVSGDILDANAVKTLIDANSDQDQSHIETVVGRINNVESNVASLQTSVGGILTNIQGINAEIGNPTDQNAGSVWEEIESLQNIVGTPAQSDTLVHDVQSLKSLISADDPVGAIDKFDEITNFLNGVESTTLNDILSNFVRYNNILDVVRTDDISNMVESPIIKNIVVLTQADYDALATKDINTEYNIVEV